MTGAMKQKASKRWYCKRPIKVAALQWTGGNTDEVKEFLGDDFLREEDIIYAVLKQGIARKHTIEISTLQGVMSASPHDYIIEGVEGEHYVCRGDIFEKTYYEVTDE